MLKLKTVVFLILIATIIPFSLFGQFSLTIEIAGLKNSKGQVLLELSNEKAEKISGFSQIIENNKCTIVIKNLQPGNYSFKYFHDENLNQKLDTNIVGMPKEGFGFANNAKGKFGPPPFEKTTFAVNSDISLKCTAIYL